MCEQFFLLAYQVPSAQGQRVLHKADGRFYNLVTAQRLLPAMQQELVYDVACGGSTLNAVTGKCDDNNAKVSLNDCSWDKTAGASELKTLWTDPDYSPDEDAFYYVRVVQNPTCRWTTYDSLRLGREPIDDSPSTVTEMAWGSPIWLKTGRD
jgi:hypothetical protein